MPSRTFALLLVCHGGRRRRVPPAPSTSFCASQPIPSAAIVVATSPPQRSSARLRLDARREGRPPTLPATSFSHPTTASCLSSSSRRLPPAAAMATAGRCSPKSSFLGGRPRETIRHPNMSPPFLFLSHFSLSYHLHTTQDGSPGLAQPPGNTFFF